MEIGDAGGAAGEVECAVGSGCEAVGRAYGGRFFFLFFLRGHNFLPRKMSSHSSDR